MNPPREFTPPESVVGPAFSELMLRLSRSRSRGLGDMEMSDEERKIFDYGVSERKRVLEHTLLLTLAQWALYRQLVTRLPQRPLRLAYVVTAFLGTSRFVASRAKRVSHEMFATIATTPTTSPLGNEARVVLAELEGPEGPYFRGICREKQFQEDLEGIVAALDAAEGRENVDHQMHPQLRLRPRLPVHRLGEGRARGEGRAEMGTGVGREVIGKGRAKEGMRKVGGMETMRKGEEREEREAPMPLVVRRVDRDREETGRGEVVWEKPFDFAAAAGSRAGFGEEEGEEEGGGKGEMTPSQRRAWERREGRMRMRKQREQGMKEEAKWA